MTLGSGEINWSAINHAYGPASDVPALINRVCADIPDIDAWHDLWSCLCHQGTVYPASYAALPLLLDVAETLPAAGRSDALILIAAIITAHDLHGVERPPTETMDRIAQVAARLADTCLQAMAGDAIIFLYLLEAAAAFDGDLTWGRNLQYLSDGTYEGQCPHLQAGALLRHRQALRIFRQRGGVDRAARGAHHHPPRRPDTPGRSRCLAP
jgi:hypothetical protein